MQPLSKRISQKRNSEIYAYEGNGDWTVTEYRKCNTSKNLICDYKRYTCWEPGLVCFGGESYEQEVGGCCTPCCS